MHVLQKYYRPKPSQSLRHQTIVLASNQLTFFFFCIFFFLKLLQKKGIDNYSSLVLVLCSCFAFLFLRNVFSVIKSPLGNQKTSFAEKGVMSTDLLMQSISWISYAKASLACFVEHDHVKGRCYVSLRWKSNSRSCRDQHSCDIFFTLSLFCFSFLDTSC